MSPVKQETDAAAGGNADESAGKAPTTKESGTKRPAETKELNEEEAKRLQARREANRMHALKSRQRSKQMLTELQQAVEQLTRDKHGLERHNAVLRAQVDVLQNQNRTLLQNQQVLMQRANMAPGAPGQQQQQQGTGASSNAAAGGGPTPATAGFMPGGFVMPCMMGMAMPGMMPPPHHPPAPQGDMNGSQQPQQTPSEGDQEQEGA